MSKQDWLEILKRSDPIVRVDTDGIAWAGFWIALAWMAVEGKIVIS